MKLYIASAIDRDAVSAMLVRNGYAVRSGLGKRFPEDKKRSAYVEILDPSRILPEPPTEDWNNEQSKTLPS